MDMLDDQPAGVTGAASGKGVAIAERPSATRCTWRHRSHPARTGQDPAAGREDAIVIGTNALGLSLAVRAPVRR
jgi:hypothetical protein